MPSILFIYTSADKTFTGRETGWYLPEAAHPYYTLAPHAKIDFAAPAGPNPPIDKSSIEAFAKDEESVKFLEDEQVKTKLANAKKLSDVNEKDYDAVFYIGGHGPVVDLAIDPVNIKLASEFWKKGKIVAAVCHGPAALVGVTDASGKPIYEGKKFTAFSNAEEEEFGWTKDVPFSQEDKIKSLGGQYEKAPKNWGVHVVVDGKLLTGQNPASAQGLAEAVLAALK